jgi:hypothetical protein
LAIDKSLAYVMPLRRFFPGTFLEFCQRKNAGSQLEVCRAFACALAKMIWVVPVRYQAG